MVKLNYSTETQVDIKNKVLKKRKNVKGLAKKIFGFWRVSDSINDGGICLCTLFTLSATNIGAINIEDNSMQLYKSSYQQKAEQFAEAYEERFMNNKDDFVINANYIK